MNGKHSLAWRILSIIMILAIALGAFSWAIPQVEASPATIYVPDDYPTIQAAVDAAGPGDTIIVRDGTYIENVDVNNDHLTIQSENGAEATIVQAANSDDHVFEVMADYVNISGLTVKGATTYSAGIYLSGADYCNISNNKASGNFQGIDLEDFSNNNIIENNNASNNYVGIYLVYSSNNDIEDNIANTNTWQGIRLHYSSDNNIGNNTANSNNSAGIYLGWHSNNNNNISNNTANSNNKDGIFLWSSSDNTLTGNTASGNNIGIRLNDSSNNNITNNIVSGNTNTAICLSSSSATISNNTIVGNGVGIFAGTQSTTEITNAVLWGNGDGLDGCTATYSDIEDGDPGEGNISENPLFVDPGSGDYHLRAGSPCIDTGTNEGAPTEDIEGNPRPIDGDGDDTAVTDMGAYEYVPPAAVVATVDFDPDTLNLRSKGRFVTVYIELPPGYDVSQIDVSSIMLNGTVPALVKPTQVGDCDGDGVPDLMVKFDRAAVQGILTIGDQVNIAISGKVAGIDFEGSDIIRVIDE